jgi:hypothetical protein
MRAEKDSPALLTAQFGSFLLFGRTRLVVAADGMFH